MLKAYKKRIKMWLESTLGSQFRSSDIFIVEFPKSGITWLSYLLANIELRLAGLNQRVTFFNVNLFIPGVENLKKLAVDRKFRHTFIKTHETYTPDFPWIVHLVRNPVDVMVSYYNYRLDHDYHGDFDAFLDHEEYGMKAWCTHFNSWFKRSRNRANYILLKYEDLKDDTHTTLKKIYSVLGTDLDVELLQGAIDQSSIDSMKEQEQLYKGFNPGYNINFVGSKGKKFTKDLVTDTQYQKIKHLYLSDLHKDLHQLYSL